MLAEHGGAARSSRSALGAPAKERNARLAQLREASRARLWIGASLIYGEDMRGALARRGAFARKIRRAADRDQRCR